MRIVSLLPAGTEIVAALGLVDALVGISHECDYPSEVNRMPRVTHCPIYGRDLSSAEVDEWVKETLSSGGDLYTLDTELLQELQPDVVITQQLCEVCGVSAKSVARALEGLSWRPEILELSPQCLADIFAELRRVAAVVGVPERGEALVASLVERVETVRSRAARAAHRPICFLMEWTDPPYCSGHWAPELVELAGGRDPLGLPGIDSSRILWERVVHAQPEVVVAACCGWKVDRILQDVPILEGYHGWGTLPAVRSGRVYAVDGSAYFSRHGPRIVDSLEILAEILHPELFTGYCRDRAVVRVAIAAAVAGKEAA